MAAHLIRSLIHSGRGATDEEVREILRRLETAPFNPASVVVHVRNRGLTYYGHPLSAREQSLFYHLVKRVVVDEQWAIGTTADEYLGDLRRATRDPNARLVLYSRWDEHMASVLAPNPIPLARHGPKARPFVYVVYSADRDSILTGYQVSGLDNIRIPEDARWLR